MPTSSKGSGKKRRVLWYFLTPGFVIAIAVLLMISYLGPSFPRVVTMTTGGVGGGFDEFGRQYQAIFAREGLELRLMPSAGSAENLRRLNNPNSGVSVGFIQSGLTSEKLSPDLVSLGAVFYEPIWFFYQGVDLGPRLEGLRGRKISIGTEGSGSREAAMKLFSLNGLDPELVQLLALPMAESGERLQRGEISAAVIVTSWDTPIIRKLLADPHIELATFPRADAYVALYPILNKLVLPAGTGNLVDNRPPVDTNLLALKASLIVRRDLNASIQDLLLDTATQVHSGPGVFQKAGQFPASEIMDLPLSREAKQFYRSGLPFLQRYLPFRLAAITGRLLVLLIPLVGVAYPLLRFLPGVYGWGMRRRVFRLYGEVKSIELELEADPAMEPAELLVRLDRLEARAIHMRVPNMFAQLIYLLRQHINLVRERLQRQKPVQHK